MGLRLQQKLVSFLSSSTAQEKDIGNLEPRVFEVSDALNEGSTRKYRVDDGASDQAVELAGLQSVQYLIVKTSRAISIKINAGSAIPIGIVDGFQYGYMLLTAPSGGVTSLSISNSSGGTAQVVVILAGDAT